MIEYFAFVCCMLSPIWLWYFNYKHKSTRRFSKVSQILHSFYSLTGIVVTGLILYFYDELFVAEKELAAAMSFKRKLFLNLGVGLWHFIFHVAMILQVFSSDRDDAIMKARFLNNNAN